jgi:(p)ppGpp synthase/HD superfamily hydrolase
MYTDRIGKALEWAAIYHENQYRKNPTRKIPAIIHPIAVAMMLEQYGYGEDIIVAAILHDTVEDTELTLETIESEFGARVASLVKQTSEEDRTRPWEERKAKFIESLKTADDDARAISCCDKIHNMKSILSSLKIGADIWSVLTRGKEKQIERFTKMYEIFKKSVKKEIVEKYKAVLEQIKQ